MFEADAPGVQVTVMAEAFDLGVAFDFVADLAFLIVDPPTDSDLTKTKFDIEAGIDAPIAVEAAIGGLTAALAGNLHMSNAVQDNFAAGDSPLTLSERPTNPAFVVVSVDDTVLKDGYQVDGQTLTFDTPQSGDISVEYPSAVTTGPAKIIFGFDPDLVPSNTMDPHFNTIGAVPFVTLLTDLDQKVKSTINGIVTAAFDADAFEGTVQKADAITIVQSLNHPAAPVIDATGIDELFTGVSDLSKLSLRQIITGVKLFLDTLEAGLQNDFLTELPVIGDGVDLSALLVGTLRDDLVVPLENRLDRDAQASEGLRQDVQQLIFDNLGPAGRNILLHDHDGVPATDMVPVTLVDDVDVFLSDPLDTPLEDLEFSMNLHLAGTEQLEVPFDLGLEALNLDLETTGGVNLNIGYSMDVGFGVNFTDGFFVQLNPDGGSPELAVTVTATLADDALDGALAKITDGVGDETTQTTQTTQWILTEGIDVKDPGASDRLSLTKITGGVFQPTLEMTGRIRLHVSSSADQVAGFAAQQLGLGGGAIGLPEVSFDLVADVSSQDPFSKAITIDPLRFNNIKLNLGGLLETVVEPLTRAFDDALGPVLGILDGAGSLLNRKLPLIGSIVDRDVRIRDIVGLSGLDRLLDFVDGVARVGDSIAGVVAGLGDGLINLGCAELVMDPSSALYFPTTRRPVPCTDDNNAPGIETFLIVDIPTDLETSVFQIDILKPKNIFGLITGQPVDIVSFGVPQVDLNGSATFGFSFEDLSFGIGAKAGIDATLRVVYDSTGLERIKEAFRSGIEPDFRSLRDGFYIRNNPGGPELEVRVDFDGGGSVKIEEFGFTVVDIGGHVDIGGKIKLELLDPNGDGQLRLDEIFALTNGFTNAGSLAGLFDLRASGHANVSGHATIFDVDFGAVDMGLASGSFSLQDLLSGGFAKRSGVADPILASPVTLDGQSVLRLNTGPFASARIYGDTDDSDGPAVISASSSGGEILITGYGVVKQPYTGSFDKILAVGGALDDRFDFSGVLIPVEIEIRGGAGRDILKGGAAADTLLGGDGGDSLFGNGGPDRLEGGNDDDTLHGGAGNDLLFGNRGNDVLRGDADPDLLRGGLGNDTLETGFGDAGVDGERGTDAFVYDETITAMPRPVNVDVFADRLAVTRNGQNWSIPFVNVASIEVETGEEPDTVTIDGAGLPLTVLTGNGRDVVNVEGVFAETTVQGGDGPDKVNVNGVFAPTTIALGNGNDTVTVTDNQSPLNIDGGAAGSFDHLVVDLDAETAALIGTLTDSRVSGLGLAGIGYTGIEDLDLKLGSERDELTIRSTITSSVATPTEIFGGGENDRVLIEGIDGKTLVVGDDGNDTVEIIYPGSSVTPYPNLSFVVETARVDASGTALSAWAFEDRDLTYQPDQTDLSTPIRILRTDGADKTTLLAGPESGDTLEISESHAAGPQIVKIDGDGVAIEKGARVLANPKTIDNDPKIIDEDGNKTFDVTAEGLEGSKAAAFRSDGRFIYVVSAPAAGVPSIAVFERNIDSQELTFVEIIKQGEVTANGSVNLGSSGDDFDITTSNTTPYLYVMSTSGLLSVFREDINTGKLTWLEVLDLTAGDLSPFFSITTVFTTPLAIAESFGRLVVVGEGTSSSPGGSVPVNLVAVFKQQSDSLLRPMTTADLIINPPRILSLSPDTLTDVVISDVARHPPGFTGHVQTIYVSTGVASNQKDAGSWSGVIGIPMYSGFRLSKPSNLPIGARVEVDAPLPQPDIKLDDNPFSTDKIFEFRADDNFVSLAKSPDGSRLYALSSAGEKKRWDNGIAPDLPGNTPSPQQLDRGRTIGGPGNVISFISVRGGISPGLGELRSPVRLEQPLQSLPPDALRASQNIIALNDSVWVEGDAGPEGGSQIVRFSTDNASRLTYDPQRSLSLSSHTIGAPLVTPDSAGNAEHLYLLENPTPTSAEKSRVQVFDPTNPNLLVSKQTLKEGDLQARAITQTDIRSVVISNNGLHLYAVSREGVLVAGRSTPSGSFKWEQVMTDGVGGADNLNGAEALAFSHDERFAYVVNPQKDAIVVLERHSSSGLLSFVESISNADLEGARAVVTSREPGGAAKFVYVAARDRNAIVRFDRSAGDGTLSNPTTTITADLDGPSSLFLIGPSPLYVTNESGSSLVVYDRNLETGALTRRQTLTDGVAGVDGLARPVAMAFSGNLINVAGQGADTIAVFRREAGGNLSFVDRVKNGFGGVRGLGGVSSVTANGEYLFATGTNEDTVVVFRQDQTSGKLTFLQRLRNDTAGLAGLPNPTSLAVFDDELFVSSAGQGAESGQVVGFSIARLAPPPIGYGVGYTGVESLTVQTAGANDEVTVQAVPIPLTVNLAGGDDSLDLRSTGTGMFTNTINAGSGSDTIRVTGNTLGSDVSINGDEPPGSPGDTLLLDPQGLPTDPSAGVTPDGTIVVKGKSVIYTGIETVRILNPPIPSSGGPYIISEGDPLNLSATAVLPFGGSAAFGWDLNGDGEFGELTIATGNLAWTDLVALGIDDDGTYPVTVRVTDERGESGEASTTLTVKDTSPTLTISGAGQVDDGSVYTLNLAAGDPGNDTIQSWTIDWGDGAVETFRGDPASVTHIYGAAPSGTQRTITARVTDEDGVVEQSTASRNIRAGSTASSGLVVSDVGGLIADVDLELDITHNDRLEMSSGPEVILAGSTARSSLVVSEVGGTIVDVDVRLDITHEAASDLGVFLISPYGTRVELFSGLGGVGESFTDVILDDQATASIADETAPFRGRFRPTGHLSDLVGEDPNGIWTLEVLNSGTDTATLNHWTLEIQHNAATNLEADLISPAGTRVGLFSDLGVMGVSFTDTILDDQATASIVDGTAPFQNRFRPTGRLSDLVGKDPNGIWTLEVLNSGTGTGTLNDWTLLINTHGPSNARTVEITHTDRILSGDSTVAEAATYMLTLSANGATAGDIDRWTIDWGDDTTTEKSFSGLPAMVEHVYADDGRFTITARVLNNDGTVHDAQNAVFVNVTNVPPTLDVAAGSSASFPEGSDFTLNLTAGDPGTDTIRSWLIDWGDGESQTIVGNPGSVTHAYADDGVYAVKAQATDEDGTYAVLTPSDKESLEVTVTNEAPILTLNSTEASVNEGSIYWLDLEVDDPGADTITAWTIKWGDGDIDTIAGNPDSVSHIYADGDNTFTITAEASDEDGGPYTTDPQGNVTVNVLDVPPSPAISGDETVFEGDPYILNLAVRDPGNDPITEWLIDWGDGTGEQRVPAGAEYVSADVPRAIADLVLERSSGPEDISGNSTVSSSLVVASVGGSLADIDVRLDITHDAIPDLALFLVSPAGTRVELLSGLGTAGDGLTDTILDDEATVPIAPGTAPFSGRFKPIEPLSKFVGENPGGTWTLEVRNSGTGIGSLNEWTLNIRSSLTSTLSIADDINIEDLNVGLDIEHTRISDLDVFLIGPDGATRVELFSDVGGRGDDFRGTILDDEADRGLSLGRGDFTGRFRPQGSLGVFDGMNAQGTWTLEITDDALREVGKLAQRSLTVNSPDSVTHVYADGDARHTISARVMDADAGEFDANTLTLDVVNRAPTLTLVGAPVAQEGVPYTLTLDTVTDPGDDSIDTLEVFWGDGTSDVFTQLGDATHTYAEGPRRYRITVVLRDGDGEYLGGELGTLDVSVHNVEPSNIVLNAPVIDENDTATLSGSFTDPGNEDLHTVVIDWGDGLSDTLTLGVGEREFAAQHHYLDDDPGGTSVDAYPVRVTVFDDDPSHNLFAVDQREIVELDPDTGARLGTIALAGLVNDAGSPALAGRTKGLAFNGDNLYRVSDDPEGTISSIDPDSRQVLASFSSPTDVVLVTIADDQGIGTIADDELTLSIADAAVVEGNSGTGSMVFTVGLAAAGGRTVRVDFATADNTAIAGRDYVAVSGTLIFAPGVTTRTIAVPIMGDDQDEVDKTFSVNLSNARNAVILDGQGVGTIVDVLGERTLSINDLTVAEGNSGTADAVLTVSLSAPDNETVTVDFAAIDGTALAGEDYGAVSGTLTFAPGEVTRMVAVLINGDRLGEANERFRVLLSQPSNAALADNEGVVTLVNDDAPTLSIDDGTLIEGDTGAAFMFFSVRLSAPLNQQVEVDYTTADGTAVADEDYRTAGGTLSFQPGETTQRVAVRINGDTRDEVNETFFVTLSNVRTRDPITKFVRLDALAADGALPWLFGLDLETAELYTLDALTGEEISRIAVSADLAEVGGIDFNTMTGTLFAVIDDNNTIVEIDPNTGAVLNTIAAPEMSSGIGLVGDRLFTAGVSGTIYELDRQSGAILNAFDDALVGTALGLAGGPAPQSPDPASTATTTVTVHNKAPTIYSLMNSAANIGDVLPGEPVTVAGTFTDAGLLDTHTATIDWGDGTTTSAVITEADGAGLLFGERTYDTGGTFMIKVTLSDDDRGTDMGTTKAFLVNAGLRDGVLRVAGTAGDDVVEIRKPVQPIAYWSFNEISGNVVADSAGTPQDGTFLAGNNPDLDDPGPPASVAPFGAGTSADFHRTTREYIAVAHDPVFETATGTVQFWFNTERTSGRQTMFSKDHSGFVDGGHLNIGLDGSRLEVRLQSTGDSFYIRTGQLIRKDTWHHLAFTLGDKGMKLYLDGELVGENGFTGGLTGNREPIVSGGSLRTNRDDSGDLSRLKISRPFEGRIDEVAFFGKALDVRQIRQLMQQGPLGARDPNGELIEVVADFLQDPGHTNAFNAAGVERIIVIAGPGDDVVRIDPSIDLPTVLNGGDDNDQLYAGTGPTLFLGGDGDDFLIGGPANDVLMGEGGDDFLIGGGGDDLLDGGEGRDSAAALRIEPIAYWNLNETDGSQVADAAGSPQHGTFFASREPDLDDAGPPLSQAPFRAETGADFHRTTQEYIAVAHNPVFEVANGTVQFWFNTDRAHARQTMFSKDHNGFVNGGHLNIGLDGKRIEVRLQSIDDSFYIRTGRLIRTDTWHHLAFTFRDKGMKLYLDGKLVGENGFTGGLTGNREPIVIGGSIRTNRDDSGDLSQLEINQPFDNRIDEVAIYDQALDAEQIRQLITRGPHRVGVGRVDAGLSGRLADYNFVFTDGMLQVADNRPETPPAVAYWSLNETEGSTVADTAGTPQHGTFFARFSPDLDDAGPDVAFGAQTGADFHRTTKEYIAVAHDPVFELDSGTVQLWFKTRRTSGEQALFAKDHSGYENGGHLDIRLDGDRIEVRLQSPDKSHHIRTGKLVKPGQWHHLAFSFGEQGMKLYLDGELVGESGFTGGLAANREAIAIGGSNRTNRDDSGDLSRLKISAPFNGYIDEVAVFSGTLNSEQIKRLQTAGPQQLIDEAATGGTIDGTDWYRNVEQLHLADGTQAYVLGAGSENVSELSAEDIQELAAGGQLVVLGDDSQILRLIGAWGSERAETIGGHILNRYSNRSATLLVLEGITVIPDQKLLIPVAYWSFNETRGKQVGENDFIGGIQANREPVVIGGSSKWNHRDVKDLSKLYIRKPFNGHIDEVAIYGKALDSKQIGQLLERGPLGVVIG